MKGDQFYFFRLYTGNETKYLFFSDMNTAIHKASDEIVAEYLRLKFTEDEVDRKDIMSQLTADAKYCNPNADIFAYFTLETMN